MKNKTFLIFAFACLAAASCLSETEAPVAQEVPAGDGILMTKLTGNPSVDHMKGNLLVFLDEETTRRIESGRLVSMVAGKLMIILRSGRGCQISSTALHTSSA